MNGHRALSWEEDRPATTPWQRHLTLPGLLALGWLVFEATSQPALGVVVVCVKFGWNDFGTAYWLRGRDPEATRGQTCFWLYLTSGFWKMGGGSVVLCFGLAIIQIEMEARNPPPQGGWHEALTVIFISALVVVVAFFLASMFAFFTLCLAWQSRTKLWLHPSLHKMRRQNQWPPAQQNSSEWNRARIIFPLALILMLLPPTICGLIDWVRNPGLFACCFAAAIVFIPAIVFSLRDKLFGWALAKTPGECWASSP